jgi:hypothetical protein
MTLLVHSVLFWEGVSRPLLRRKKITYIAELKTEKGCASSLGLLSDIGTH